MDSEPLGAAPPLLYEASLRGAVAHGAQLDRLFQRLRGLCGANGSPLVEHELVFLPSVARTREIRKEDEILRLRCSTIDEKRAVHEQSWSIVFLGNPDPSVVRTTTVRLFIKSDMDHDVFPFMAAIGYSLDFEFLRRGQTFVYRKLLTITISRMYQFTNLHDYASAEPLDENTWFVEITAPAVLSENIPEMDAELNALSTHLAGFVNLYHVQNSIFFQKNLRT